MGYIENIINITNNIVFYIYQYYYITIVNIINIINNIYNYIKYLYNNACYFTSYCCSLLSVRPLYIVLQLSEQRIFLCIVWFPWRDNL